MDPFYQNLPQVYQTIEDKFNGWRNPFLERSDYLKSLDILTPICFPDDVIVPNVATKIPRTALVLGEGYVLKLRAYKTKEEVSITAIDGFGDNYLAVHIEEDNQYMLKKYGFTRENGFWVPKHRVIGLELKEGKIKVNPAGKGFTITEDASESGTYQVKDIQPEMFQQLQNGKEFEQSYQRHMFWLGWLYHHPEIHVSIRRHGTPANPQEAISRMLLARIKDNVGEILIGDLDNLVFDKA